MAAIGGAPKSPVQLTDELKAPNTNRPLRRRRSASLARLRGFAGGKAGFWIFLVRKYLIWNVWATGNIVKKACSEDLPDSQGIVFLLTHIVQPLCVWYKA